MLLAAIGILCALTVVTSATFLVGWREALLGSLGFVSLAILPTAWLGPSVVALVATAAALHGVFRPQARGVTVLLGGAAGWSWCAVLATQGLPLPISVALLVCVVVTCAWLVRRSPGFAPDWLRDEALLIVGLLGITVAAGPNIADGYATAVALRAMPLAEQSVAKSEAALYVTAGFFAAGGFFAAWRRA